MANPVELSRYSTSETLPAQVEGGLLHEVRTFFEGSVFAAGVSYVGFVVLLFVLLAAVLLAPVLAIALPVACALHDARRVSGTA